MSAFFNMLFAKISAVLKWFADLFISVFVALWDMFKDLFSWGFDQVLSIGVDAVNSLPLDGITSNVQGLGSIPANVLQVLSALGFGQALALISAALLIRFTLQLIPFVRLGS